MRFEPLEKWVLDERMNERTNVGFRLFCGQRSVVGVRQNLAMTLSRFKVIPYLSICTYIGSSKTFFFYCMARLSVKTGSHISNNSTRPNSRLLYITLD